jgi:amino acid transporter
VFFLGLVVGIAVLTVLLIPRLRSRREHGLSSWERARPVAVLVLVLGVISFINAGLAAMHDLPHGLLLFLPLLPVWLGAGAVFYWVYQRDQSSR